MDPRPQRRGHALFQYLFVPALLALSARAWLFRGPGDASGGGGATGVLLIAIVAIWLAEQLYPANASWNYRLLTDIPHGWNRLARDVFYLVVVTAVSSGLIALAARGLHAWTLPALRHPVWPSGAPWPVQVLLAFFGIELFSYWLHRAAHRVPLLWQFHSTHHAVTELGGLKALRTHPVENVFFYFARTVPLLLLGADPRALTAATYLGALLGLLAHANVRVSERVLGLVVNLPQYHQVHHSAALDESNSNFGCHTVLWDRLFGTFRGEAREGLVIGIRPVGPRSLSQELLWPLYRSVTAQADSSSSNGSIAPSASERSSAS